MPRYLKQYDDYSCGPTAILNALKWAGASVSYRTHYKRVAKYCKVAEGDLKDRGTFSPDLDRTLRAMGRHYLTVRKVRSCTIQQLADHLQNGGAAILAHVEGEGAFYTRQDEAEGHFSFWFDSDGLTFTGANDGGDGAIIVRSRKEMIHKIKKRKHAGALYPEVWLLSKCDRSK